MSDHESIRELIAAVALGAADPQERAAVERHAATCHDCRAELEGLRAATAGLALDVPQLDPPAGLRRRVLGSVRDDARRRGVRAAPRRRLLTWPALAGALAVLAAGLVAWNVSLRGGTDPAREIAVVGSADAPAATGRVVIRDDGTAVVRVTGLPELPPGRGYELWTIRDGVPRSEGFAARTAAGEVVVATADLGTASALAITAEDRTNTDAPTDAPLVVAQL